MDGHLEPMTLPPIVALTTVWRKVRQLDLGDQQTTALHRLFGAGDTEKVEASLDGGVFEFPIVLPGDRRTCIRVLRGDGLTGRQRHAAQYRVLQLPAEGRNPGLWAVQDMETGALVHEDDRVLRWGIASSAQSWIRRELARGDYRGRDGHARQAS
ncbi:hypothetical protein [Kitasatospora sp. NPDC093806]|uniref:hypothetical protein n=1 Tax=Kitasatospora sp. NPDC093806 TaxID=3155075 RepID=UPI00341C558E